MGALVPELCFFWQCPRGPEASDSEPCNFLVMNTHYNKRKKFCSGGYNRWSSAESRRPNIHPWPKVNSNSEGSMFSDPVLRQSYRSLGRLLPMCCNIPRPARMSSTWHPFLSIFTVHVR